MGDCAADAAIFLALGFGAGRAALGRPAPVLGLMAAAPVIALFPQLKTRPRPPSAVATYARARRLAL